VLAGTAGEEDERRKPPRPATIRQFEPLGAQLAPLAPALREYLAAHPERHETNSEILRLVWRIERDPAQVLPPLRAALSLGPRWEYDYANHPPKASLELAAELGEHARPLVELIRAALNSPMGWLRAAAADSLVRLDAADADELVPILVPDPEKAYRWEWSAAAPALEVVAALRATQAIPRLTGWLTTDKRVQGHEDDTVEVDELFQARVRRILADVSLVTPDGDR
jgi:hypothetical protein